MPDAVEVVRALASNHSRAPSHRFPKQHRLLHALEYSRVLRYGRTNSMGALRMVVMDNDLAVSRLGLAISKKALPSAVARNRLKRIARECFRQQISQPAIPRDLLLQVRRPVARASREMWRENFFALLHNCR